MRRSAEYGGLAKIFAELAGRQTVWDPFLEGFNVEQSQVVNEWLTQGERRGLVPLQAQVLAVLQARFATGLPADLTAAVKSQWDAITLLRWYDLAKEAADLTAVRQGIGMS